MLHGLISQDGRATVDGAPINRQSGRRERSRRAGVDNFDNVQDCCRVASKPHNVYEVRRL